MTNDNDEPAGGSGGYPLVLAAKYLFVGLTGLLLAPLVVFFVVPVWMLMCWGYSTCLSFGWTNNEDDRFFNKWLG
jgi:hypothetical protein